MNIVPALMKRFAIGGRTILSGVPEGYDAVILADIARTLKDQPLLHVCLDDQRQASLGEALGFFAPDLEVAVFPAWDCLPYDRVSPAAEIAARRLATLSRLASRPAAPR